MSKQKTKKSTAASNSQIRPQKSISALDEALRGCKKADLVDLLLQLAKANSGIQRQLIAALEVVGPPAELIAATRQAIVDGTKFDPRQINYNFDFDCGAYEAVKRNFELLIKSGQLRAAMQLSLDLMSLGSYQVEMSDEGLMQDDIEQCLNVVLESLGSCDLPEREVVAWCKEMLHRDRVKFIVNDQLKSLRDNFKSSAAPRRQRKTVSANPGIQ